MRKPIFIALTLLVAMSYCCTKKLCVGSQLPAIIIKFNNPSIYDGTRVVVYEMAGNVKMDSVVKTEYFSYPITILPFSTHDNGEAENLKYIITRKNHSNELSNFNCDFFEKVVKCNQCFPFGHDKQEFWAYDNFTFKMDGKDFSNPDTLYLD